MKDIFCNGKSDHQYPVRFWLKQSFNVERSCTSFYSFHFGPQVMATSWDQARKATARIDEFHIVVTTSSLSEVPSGRRRLCKCAWQEQKDLYWMKHHHIKCIAYPTDANCLVSKDRIGPLRVNPIHNHSLANTKYMSSSNLSSSWFYSIPTIGGWIKIALLMKTSLLMDVLARSTGEAEFWVVACACAWYCMAATVPILARKKNKGNEDLKAETQVKLSASSNEMIIESCLQEAY